MKKIIFKTEVDGIDGYLVGKLKGYAAGSLCLEEVSRLFSSQSFPHNKKFLLTISDTQKEDAVRVMLTRPDDIETLYPHWHNYDGGGVFLDSSTDKLVWAVMNRLLGKEAKSGNVWVSLKPVKSVKPVAKKSKNFS